MIFDLDIYTSTIGSLVAAHYLCGHCPSPFFIKRKWRRFKKYDELKDTYYMPKNFNSIKEMVHKVRTYFRLDEVDLPIVLVVGDTGNALFTVLYNGMILPNMENGQPLSTFLHPVKVYDLEGNEIKDYKTL